MDVYACDHTKELIIKAHNNDKSAREKLVIDNSGLVGVDGAIDMILKFIELKEKNMGKDI